jgi:hypothetical protein
VAVHSAHKDSSKRPILRSLRELALQRFDLTTLHQPLSILCDLNGLSELTISRCINVVDFFSDMASLVDGGALQLSHFALKTFGYEEEQRSEEVMEAAYLALRNLVKVPKLQGLHLSWGQEPPLGSILPELPLGAPNLRCLGIYDGRDIMHHESLHSSDNLHDVLKRCPQLQALGWTIDGAGLLDLQYTQHLMDDTFMVRLEVTTLLSLAYAL